ncbi:Sec-independent protein translocase protein TatAy [compost metagenome]
MNLGWTEILLIGGIALLVFGPKKLPDLGRSLGEAIRGFKKGITQEEEHEREVPPVQVAQNHAKPVNEKVVEEVKEEDKNKV